MKALIWFLFGVTFCVLAYYLYTLDPASATGTAPPPAFHEKGREAVESVEGQLKARRLAPDDIRTDLAKSGSVVRRNAQVLGEKITDTRIAAMIHAKFVLHRELHAHDIAVECHDGNVTLRGSVGSHELIGKAVAIALDTEGVRAVDSKLSPTPSP